MADELDSSNKFMIGISGARIVHLRPIPHTISKDDALNLAAWLVALVDDHENFTDVLAAVQRT